MDHGQIAYLLNAQGRDAGTQVPVEALSAKGRRRHGNRGSQVDLGRCQPKQAAGARARNRAGVIAKARRKIGWNLYDCKLSQQPEAGARMLAHWPAS
jgi:hypothetical protein